MTQTLFEKLMTCNEFSKHMIYKLNFFIDMCVCLSFKSTLSKILQNLVGHITVKMRTAST